MILASDERDALCRVLGLTSPSLLDDAVSLSPASRYRAFTISKGNGRTRTIHEPHAALKALQRRVLRDLLYRVPVSPLAHGFVPGRSVVTQANVHAPTASALLAVDLQDAYPSVAAPRVEATLQWTLGPYLAGFYPPRRPEPWRAPAAGAPRRPTPRKAWPALHGDLVGRVCRALADLCCHEGKLPQGAPTSGALLNLVCARLDRLCLGLVLERGKDVPGLRYTRYADDLTFTASVPIGDDLDARVVEAVRSSGFRVNLRKKVRTTTRQGDLVICGVRITKERKLGLPRPALRAFRALFHRVAALEPLAVPEELRREVRGAIGWLTLVTPECPRVLAAPLGEALGRHGAWLRPPRRGLGLARAGVGPYG